MRYVENRKEKVLYASNLPHLPEPDEQQYYDGQWLFNEQAAADFSETGAGKTLNFLTAWSNLIFSYANGSYAYDDKRAPSVLCVSSAKGARAVVENAATYMHKILPANVTGSHLPIVRAIQSRGVQYHSTQSRMPAFNVAFTAMPYSWFSRAKPDQIKKMQGKYAYIILDECHYVSNESARTSRIIGNFFDDPACLLYKCLYITAASGTPSERYNDGYWNIISRLFPGFLDVLGISSQQQFLRRYTVGMRDPHTGVYRATGNKRTDELIKYIYDVKNGGFAIRRPAPRPYTLKQKVIDLPITDSDAVQEDNERLRMLNNGEEAPRNRNENRALYGELYNELGEAKLNCLDADAKYLRKIREYAGDTPILWLAYHTDIINGMREISERVTGRKCVVIDGKTLPSKAIKHVEMFNKGAVDVVGQIHAMGESLNMQDACHTVVLVEESLVEAKNRQAINRVARRGQKSEVVTVFRIRAPNKLQEKRVQRLLAGKGKAHDAVTDLTSISGA